MAVLSYLDFFSTGVQRVALATAANMCKKLPSDAADFVMEAVPLLTNLLQYHDAKGFLQKQPASCSSKFHRSEACKWHQHRIFDKENGQAAPSRRGLLDWTDSSHGRRGNEAEWLFGLFAVEVVKLAVWMGKMKAGTTVGSTRQWQTAWWSWAAMDVELKLELDGERRR
ncbi:uncharacterized protein [Nicotiana sylvestris]|uniref:uncharacterized protein isoform X2 n=1 Tax=Nicotiana sylvestris TaxID=4096 RepID=UPI00388CD66F